MASFSVVIDANLAIFSVIMTPQSPQAVGAMEDLAGRGAGLFAPGLWWFEVTSAIHQYRHAELISEEVAYQALEILTARFGVQAVEVPVRSAFDWATRLGQRAAYDGFYLAAAEQLGAELWTADRDLVKRARQAGAGWVQLIGETLP